MMTLDRVPMRAVLRKVAPRRCRGCQSSVTMGASRDAVSKRRARVSNIPGSLPRPEGGCGARGSARTRGFKHGLGSVGQTLGWVQRLRPRLFVRMVRQRGVRNGRTLCRCAAKGRVPVWAVGPSAWKAERQRAGACPCQPRPGARRSVPSSGTATESVFEIVPYFRMLRCRRSRRWSVSGLSTRIS